MKKLFTILAVASMMLTSVFGFSSCTNDDSDFNRATQQPSLQTQQQTVKQDASLYTVATAEQMNYMDIVYVVNVDGQNKEIHQSQMTQVDDSEFSGAIQLVEAFDSIGSQVRANVYKYSFGAAGSAKIVGVKYNALVDSTDQKTNIVTGYTVRLGNSQFNSIEDSQIYKGVTDIKGLAQTLTK